jgi:hypothetical protein
MEKPKLTPLKIAVSTEPKQALTESDRNALEEWVAGIRLRGYDPTFVTHDKDENLEDLRKFAEVHRVGFQYFAPPIVKGTALDREKAASPARLVAISVVQCIKIGKGGEIAKECAAAELPIWSFKTKQ